MRELILESVKYCKKKPMLKPSLFNKLRRIELLMELHLTATECHLPYGITQCYLHPTQVNTPRFNPSQTGRYSIYLPRKVGRLY